MENDLLTTEQAAAVLGYQPGHLRTIVKNTKQGKPGPQIQFFQIGSGPIKFRREWLDEFIEKNSIAPGQIQLRKKPTTTKSSDVRRYDLSKFSWTLPNEKSKAARK